MANSDTDKHSEIEKEWIKEQIRLQKDIKTYDTFKTIKYVGGLDISFDKKQPDNACAYLTVMKYSDKGVGEIVYENHVLDRLKLPYISGFLAFREMPLYLPLIKELARTNPEFIPDVLLIDGSGVLHHRGCGSASHIGLVLGISTIGTAKTLLSYDGLDERVVKAAFKASPILEYPLKGTTGATHGMAIALAAHQNPIYVSIGTGICLESAVKIVRSCCKFRVPEPIRNSDIKSKLYF